MVVREYQPHTWFFLSLLAIIDLVPISAALGNEPEFVPPDCGLNSLFLLLELSGDHVDLDRLRRALPPQSPRGYSLLELSDAASGLGHRCRGIALQKGEPPPNRPALVFMGDETHGHFAVIRPVTGTDLSRVQVVDPPYPPLMVDWTSLTSDPHWTGRVLIRSSLADSIVPYLFVASILMSGLLLSVRSIRDRLVRLAVALRARPRM